MALGGDWNIAPQDEDVWDMKVFATSTHVTAAERAAFRAFVEDGFADLVRPHAPGPGVYTYLDYYRQRFERNKGMRIDFVLGSPALQTGWWTPSSTATSAPARAPPTTPRSSWTCRTDDATAAWAHSGQPFGRSDFGSYIGCNDARAG